MRNVLTIAVMLVTTATLMAADRPPNIVILFADDMAYADLACFGSKVNDTPHLDRMAKEGMRLTSFYVTTPVCSASRAALLTGCYPLRVGITGVLDHRSTRALHGDEITIAEVAKQKGYATGCFGKWHVGHQKEHLPLAQGFDEFLGTPYSHDMWPFHPHAPSLYPPLPVMDGDKVVQTNPNPGALTTMCAERAVAFIEKNKDKPFLLYMPFNLPHVPLGVSEKFKDKSRNGIYGDVIMEIDWAAGQVLDTLRKHKLESNTLVIFASDNGPWEPYGNQAGNKGVLRGAKGSTWEGGMRVPCIAWWPGKVPAGAVSDEVVGTIDVLPTISAMLGVEAAKDRVIDGRDIGAILRGEAGAKAPRSSHFYCLNDTVQAVRSGEWKLHVRVFESKDKPAVVEAGALYNLKTDTGEQIDVAGKNADVVKRLSDEVKSFIEELRKNSREPGKVRV